MAAYEGYRPVGVTDEGDLPPRVQQRIRENVVASTEFSSGLALELGDESSEARSILDNTTADIVAQEVPPRVALAIANDTTFGAAASAYISEQGQELLASSARGAAAEALTKDEFGRIVRNVSLNPVLAVDSAGWFAQWFGSGGAGTSGRVTGAGPEGENVFRKEWTTGGAASQDIFPVHRAPVEAGKRYAVSIAFKSSRLLQQAGAKAGFLRLSWLNSSNTEIGVTDAPQHLQPDAFPAGQWVTVFSAMNALAPVGAVNVDIKFRLNTNTGAWSPADVVEATKAFVTPEVGFTRYRDGEDEGGYWVGAVGQSASRVAVVAGAYEPSVRDAAGGALAPRTAFTHLGTVIDRGSTGDPDVGYVESPAVFIDPATGRLAAVYTGYTSTDSAGIASLCLAYSDDGISWEKQGAIFTGSGVVAAPDRYGATGSFVWVDGDEQGVIYHLFYIGLANPGYEAPGSNKTICHATTRDLRNGPWTRQGTVIARLTGTWRSNHVWRPTIIFAKQRYWMFFNATNAAGKERMGYAVSESLYGPWAVDDVNSPLLDETGFEGYFIYGGDPFVTAEAHHARVDFNRVDAASGGSDWGDSWATTTWEQFPLGWVVRGDTTRALPAQSPVQGFKPTIFRLGGRVLHYGVQNGRIRLSYTDATA